MLGRAELVGERKHSWMSGSTPEIPTVPTFYYSLYLYNIFFVGFISLLVLSAFSNEIHIYESSFHFTIDLHVIMYIYPDRIFGVLSHLRITLILANDSHWRMVNCLRDTSIWWDEKHRLPILMKLTRACTNPHIDKRIH